MSVNTVRVKLVTYSHIQIDTDNGIAWEIRDYFSYFVPGYKFMPKYRNGMWDGKIRIFDYNKRLLPAGLFSKLKKFCTDRDYDLVTVPSPLGMPDATEEIDLKGLYDFIKNLNLHSRGEPITIHDYQFSAVAKALRNKRMTLVSPTGSGKSLIIYTMMRWYYERTNEKILVIVPTTDLVEQMYNDFADYSSENGFDVPNTCHKIYSGQEKTNVNDRIFISTWQSIYKLPVTWFRQFRVIFGDEAHLFTADSLTKSMNKAETAEYRFGLTGTLSDMKTHELVIEGIFGSINNVVRTVELQKKKTLADLQIEAITLEYPEDVRKNFGKMTYQKEIDWLVRHEGRNRFLINLADSLEGNTLMLFQFVDKHGKVLYDMMKQTSKHRVFFVAGEVDKLDRVAIRNIVENQAKSTIVASLGTFSTGVNIRNLHNIILCSPSKSKIKVLQSIGRSLRLADNGRESTLYDIIDDLSYGKKQNYAKLHGTERLRIYTDEQFKVRKHKVMMK